MNHQTETRIVAGVLFFIVATTATAFACGWMGTWHSVRFNTYQSERDMGRLPPLPTMANGLNSLRNSWNEDDYYTSPQQSEDEIDALWQRAARAEEEGKLTEIRSMLQDYLEQTTINRGVIYPTDRQTRRNSAIDRLDALSALDHGSKTARVQAYLNARRHYDLSAPEKVEEELSQIGSDVNLRDNAAYLRAAQLYAKNEFEKAAQAFGKIARQYPESEKREASMFMAAVSVMKTSLAYSPTSGDEAHLHEYGADNISGPHHVEIDKPWYAALAGFKRLMAQYPRGRYFDDAHGWVAYLLLRKSDRAAALVEYYKLLADKQDENTRIEAAFSLELVRHHASDEEMSRVEKQLAQEPEAALAYAYHNIYNYSNNIELTYEDSDSEATELIPDQEKRAQDKQEAASRKELARSLDFSRRLMERYPNLALGGAFALRVAQANAELGNDKDASQFAQRALQSRLNDNERMQALWTFGVAEHRLKNFSSARKSFETLLHDYPQTTLTEEARRYLAMIAEVAGDIDAALEQYLALNYKLDAAYLVDVLMSIDQLENFIAQHQDSPKVNQLTYALGVRYLRANLWDQARATFGKVRATTAIGGDSLWGNDCVSDKSNCIDPKEPPDAYMEETVVTTRLVMRDVQTANDLEALERKVKQAVGDEAKAEAMYQLASYQFDSSSLLFYNPVAWNGERYWNISHLANESRFRAGSESQILFAYMQEHDTLARALRIYLEVVEYYPSTRAAADSLYTAAVCHERLSQYNDYWREIYAIGLHAGTRLVTYNDVRAKYPRYQLPRGTFNWEASTRTVDGGPGFAPKPKPAPRPSRFQRVKLLVENFMNPIVLFWNETGRRGLSLLTILVAMLFTARIATQNRKLLRPKLLRVRTRYGQKMRDAQPPADTLWRSSLLDELWQETKRYAGKRVLEFWLLMQDRNSRPILFRNILSHSFLAALIVSLLWTVHFG